MKTKGINSERTKKINRLLVLRLLCTGSGLSRAEITRKVGLAKMTVTNIVSELIDGGLLCETSTIDTSAPRSGRKRIGLRLSDTSPLCVGVWVSRDFCIGILSTMDLQVLGQQRIDFCDDETPASVTDKIARLVEELTQNQTRRILGVGIATVGPLDAATGTILNPPDFFGIRSYPLAQRLSQRLSLPVFVQNDMNAGALVEKLFGLGRDSANFAYVGLSNGVGSGIIIGDTLFEGMKGFAGEIGHTILMMNGKPCRCGNRGCLEAYVNAPDICTDFSQKLGHSFTDFGELCRFCETDPQGARLLHSILQMLATAMVSLCNLVDPQMLVLGHEGAFFTDNQIQTLATLLNEGIFAKGVVNVEVVRSSYGFYAPVFGAAAVVLHRVLEGELPYDDACCAD